jgi:hypothetical protein
MGDDRKADAPLDFAVNDPAYVPRKGGSGRAGRSITAL